MLVGGKQVGRVYHRHEPTETLGTEAFEGRPGDGTLSRAD
jgi:hypothetical protein